jgi:rubredoxin
MSAFENFGAPQAERPEDRMECGICWQVYDPAVGDAVWQVPAGTPFAELPEDWRCPNCDAAKLKFMRVEA